MSLRICALAVVLIGGCSESSTDSAELVPTAAEVRLTRRAFDGAPPVIPHPPLSGSCTFCHTPEGGRQVPEIGIAPANPHTRTPGMSMESRCRQCHVFKVSDDTFTTTGFEGFFASLHSDSGTPSDSPPVIPHDEFMREDCKSCHTGHAARPEITCRHATRDRCRQCHVQQQSVAPFTPNQ